jgi:ABC-type Fe3+-hydroxamate transport system substrate-binding protein
MFEMLDQLNRKVVLNTWPPKRIVSLVPSQTELLADLGLEEEVTGITKFCVHPQNWFRNKTRIGGTKQVNIEKVKALKPDLILANKEENVKEQIEALEKIAPVWISDVNTFEDAIHMIKSIGAITAKEKKAQLLVDQIITGFETLPFFCGKENQPGLFPEIGIKTCYLIWRNPYMTIGGDTFINNMLKLCGLQNVFENQKRYPEINLQHLAALDTQLVLLSSEPYPFKDKHTEEIKAVFPGVQILMVDGEIFSWYGSRLLYATQYFRELMNRINELIRLQNDAGN